MRHARFWKVCEVAAAVASLVSCCTGWTLWMHFAYTRPTAPNLADGRVYALNTHGWLVYLDATEHTALQLFGVGFLVLFATAVVIDRVKKPFAKKGTPTAVTARCAPPRR